MSDADLGGDPPCWAHLFEDDDEEIEAASNDEANVPGSAGDSKPTDG